MKTTIGLAALFIVVLVGGYVLMKPAPQAPAPSTSQTETAQSTSTVNAASLSTTPQTSSTHNGTSTSYTSVQIAAHATSKSCWTSISGNVYDLTSWISQHPGGEARILNICGRDGTSDFMGQHGNDSQAQAMLATFKIGTLSR